MSTDSKVLAAYAKATGESKKLFEHSYANAQAVEEAGIIAFDGGQACQTLEELGPFKPLLNGSIHFTMAAADKAAQVGPWHHLHNKMLEGFAAGGGITSEADAIACASMVVRDTTWEVAAERAVLKAALQVLKTDDAIFDFAYLLSDKARGVLFGCLNRITLSSAKTKA